MRFRGRACGCRGAAEVLHEFAKRPFALFRWPFRTPPASALAVAALGSTLKQEPRGLALTAGWFGAGPCWRDKKFTLSAQGSGPPVRDLALAQAHRYPLGVGGLAAPRNPFPAFLGGLPPRPAPPRPRRWSPPRNDGGDGGVARPQRWAGYRKETLTKGMDLPFLLRPPYPAPRSQGGAPRESPGGFGELDLGYGS